MRRKTAYIFILLAGFFYLAHAFIPHHHHESLVCIGNGHPSHNHEEPHGDCPVENEKNSKEGSHCVVNMEILLRFSETIYDHHGQNTDKSNDSESSGNFFTSFVDNGSAILPEESYLYSFQSLHEYQNYIINLPCPRGPPVS